MKYQAPSGSTDPNASYVDKDTPGAVRGSAVPALAIEDPQREMQDLIEKSGLTPTEAELQLARAVQTGKVNFAAGIGTNSIAATLLPAPAAYTDGMLVRIRIQNTNTGASNLNLNGLGAKVIRGHDNADIAAGDLVAGELVTLVFDASLNVFKIVGGSRSFDALSSQAGTWNYAAVGGTANALTATLIPAPASLTNGMRIWIFPSALNTGPATLNLNGLGVAPIVDDRAQPLAAGDLQTRATEIIYIGGSWRLVQKPGGQLARVITIATAGAGIYVPSPGTRRIIVRGQGGGGAGGGCPATGAGNAAAGGGGSCGAFGFKEIQNPGNTNYVVGAAGVAVSGANGGGGGSTTFGAVLTLPGGGGGNVGVATTGASSNGAYSFSGNPSGADQGSRGQGGSFGITASAASAIGGCGGSSQYGSGGSYAGQNGAGSLTGGAASGNGAGGGGAAAVATGVASIGGNGAPGILIIEEYV